MKMLGCLGDFIFLNVVIMGAFKKKMSQSFEKVLNFLAPLPLYTYDHVVYFED